MSQFDPNMCLHLQMFRIQFMFNVKSFTKTIQFDAGHLICMDRFSVKMARKSLLYPMKTLLLTLIDFNGFSEPQQNHIRVN